MESQLQPHQQRVVDEKNELQEKTEKLGQFILNSPIYLTLPEEEKTDLNEQHYFMNCYLDILNSRINRF
jgi:hypothetical protein